MGEPRHMLVRLVRTDWKLAAGVCVAAGISAQASRNRIIS
jgi:hypothetical protein